MEIQVQMIVRWSFFTITCLSSIAITVTSAQTLAQSKTLMTDLLNGYENRLRQNSDQSTPVQVNVTFDLVAIQDFDEIKEKFSLVGLLYMTWFDESLKWNPSLYGNANSLLFKIKDIWYPVLILANAFEDIEDIGDTWMTARVYANGLVVFAPGGVFKSTCSVDVSYYPFDEQQCNLMFVPWGYNANELVLYSVRDTILQTYWTKNGEWDITKSSVHSAVLNDMYIFNLDFTLKRKPIFLVVNVMLPIVFMGVINILVFVLPPQSGERVSFAITVLLAIAVFLTLVGDNLPKTSEPMSILSYYLMISLVISLLICVLAILNLRLYFKDPTVPVSNWCKNLVRIINCGCNSKCRSTKNTNQVHSFTEEVERKPPLDFKTKSKKTEHESDLEGDVEITWQDVSFAVDKISFVSTLLTIVITTIAFLAVLASGSS